MQQHYAGRFGTTPYRSTHIGPRLRVARERAGLKQGQLARLLGVDECMPSRWECTDSTRYKPVPGHHLPRLASILNTTIADLAPDALMPEPPPSPVTDLEDARSWRPLLDEVTLAPDFEDDGAYEEADGVTATRAVVYSTGEDGGGATHMAGRPFGTWRIRCWQCDHTTMVESAYTREGSPLCSWCGVRLRAQVTVSVTRAT